MIRSRADYLDYLERDRIALGRTRTIKSLLTDEVWKFQRALRRIEYATNCRKNFLYWLWAKYRFRTLSLRLGFSIPPNVFGPGLSIGHVGAIVVNDAARVGANCRLHNFVNIGTEAGHRDRAPRIGDNCYIAPGAKLFGAITIGHNTMIGANAVVNKNFPEGGQRLVGIPARPLPPKSDQV